MCLINIDNLKLLKMSFKLFCRNFCVIYTAAFNSQHSKITLKIIRFKKYNWNCSLSFYFSALKLTLSFFKTHFELLGNKDQGLVFKSEN